MRHQTPVLPVVVGRVHEVERVAHAVIEMQKMDRQAIVQRVAYRVDNPRIREDALDEADVEEIVRALVGDVPLAGKHLR
jgi:hypothetical protein